MENDVTKRLPHGNRNVYIRTTMVIYVGNIILGCGMNSYSPLATDFAKKYETDVDQVSLIFTILMISYMIGALLTSFVYNYIKRQLGVAVVLGGIATALYVTPYCPNLISLYIVSGVLGICNGVYDASQVVWVMEMWQGASGPFIQGQHFLFAIGALIPGFLMAPFLSNETDSEASVSSSAEMWIPFTILGVFATIAATLQLALYIFKPYFPPPREDRRGIDLKADQKSSTALKIKLIVFSAIFLGFYQGMEVSSGQFISTFGQFGDYTLSESQGSLLFTAMMSFYAGGRGLGILAILKIPPKFILFFNLVTILVACILLLFSNVGLWVIWVGSSIMGLGFSTVYPSFCAYIERHLEFTNAIGSLMLVCGSLIGALYPIVIGFQIENNSLVLVYVNLFTLATITIAFGIILKLTTSRWRC